ncbi:unnamed protein product [Allacma fusca]|uniref:Carboxylesterase type B domain-containing protein n=1 Tax=Allacma fusca TaxID=39272 RepID=A0A8J2JIX8_9HEXA|nr:unnamed protein product [Allacma fusca]
MRTLYLTIGVFYLALLQIILGSEIVETTSGKVKGSTGESRDGRKFHQFLGIPYAKAKRFMPPTDPDSWTDVRDATSHGNMCPQIQENVQNPSESVLLDSEDCLNLDVFTPKYQASLNKCFRYLDYDVTANDSLAVTAKIMDNYFGGNSIDEKNFKDLGINKSSPDYQLSKNFIRMLSSFAENGKPKPWGETTQWPPYNTDEEKPFRLQISKSQLRRNFETYSI